MNESQYYLELMRPSWAPPSWLFGPVWTVLYAIIAVSFGAVLVKIARGELPKSLAVPLVLNLAFNFAFTYIQFGLQNNALATVDILLVLATLIWSLVALWPHMRWFVYANIPYLLWVSFATVLQITITVINR